MLSGRMLQDAVNDACPVEPGRDREASGRRGRLEPADLPHPPYVQLQVRPLRAQWIQTPITAPGKVAAQVRFGVLARRSREAGQVDGYCELQPVCEHSCGTGGDQGHLGGVHHASTVRRACVFRKLARRASDMARESVLHSCTIVGAREYI